MSGASVGTDFNQSLDVKSNVTAKVTFYDVVAVDGFTETGNFVIGQILNTGVRIDVCSFQNVIGEFSANTIDIGQAYLNALFARQVYTGYTSHLLLHLHWLFCV